MISDAYGSPKREGVFPMERRKLGGGIVREHEIHTRVRVH